MNVRKMLFLAAVFLWLLGGAMVICSGPTRFRGHTGAASTVIASQDGKTLASVSFRDKTVRLWDVAEHKERANFPTQGKFCSIAFSPDGQTLAWAVSSDNTIQLCDAMTGAGKATFQGHTDSVWAVTFSPEGNTLASGSFDKTVRLWDVATRRERAVLRAHAHGVSSLCFSPDGKTLASGGRETIKLWEVNTGRERATLQVNRDYPVEHLAFSPDGKILASATMLAAVVRLWDVANGQERFIERPDWLGEDEEYVRYMAFSPDGATLVMGNAETIGLWDVATGKNTAAFRLWQHPLDLSFPGILDSLGLRVKDHWRWIDSVFYTPEGKLMALGVDDSTVTLWEVHRRVGGAGIVGVVGMVLGGIAASLFVTVAVWVVFTRHRESRTASPTPRQRPAAQPATPGAVLDLSFRFGVVVALLLLAYVLVR